MGLAKSATDHFLTQEPLIWTDNHLTNLNALALASMKSCGERAYADGTLQRHNRLCRFVLLEPGFECNKKAEDCASGRHETGG